MATNRKKSSCGKCGTPITTRSKHCRSCRQQLPRPHRIPVAGLVLAWADRALCRYTGDPDDWFPRKNDADGLAHFAKRVCGMCPVRVPCLEEALRHPAESDHGIWGGTTATQRKEIRRRRGLP